MRQVVLDTETTGINPEQGHRIIEIGCVELVGRRLTGRTYHQYIHPDRVVEEEAIQVHGITNEFLADKPRFAEIVAAFLDFIRGAELVIHNAPFDIGFIDCELKRLEKGGGESYPKTAEICGVVDTLVMARKKHPGQKNSLDALCRRYMIDNSHRDLHGALLDSEILADVYLAMTGGQTTLSLGGFEGGADGEASEQIIRIAADRPALTVLKADEAELAAHDARLQALREKGVDVVWQS